MAASNGNGSRTGPSGADAVLAIASTQKLDEVSRTLVRLDERTKSIQNDMVKKEHLTGFKNWMLGGVIGVLLLLVGLLATIVYSNGALSAPPPSSSPTDTKPVSEAD